ncbi:hypothetical protein ABTM71_19255, partial [Acinetobacter baumannii]
AMTSEFLAKGGKIVHCPPGGSEEVVYKKGSCNRRPAASAAGRTAGVARGPAAAASEPAASASPFGNDAVPGTDED